MTYVWIVLNLSKSEKFILAPFAEKYKVFSDDEEGRKKLVEHAVSIGYSDWLGMGLNSQPGMANSYQCGDAHVMIMRTTVEGKT